MPVEAVPLTELERADIGLKQGGHTVFYPLPPTGVFFDMGGTRATVWYTEADAENALKTFERAFKAAYPNAKRTNDTAHPNENGMRVSTYEVDFGNSRLASVEAHYPERNAQAPKFIVYIMAQARKQ